MTVLDDSLLKAAKYGDDQAIAALVRSHHRPLRAFVAMLVVDVSVVDDLAQEVFLRALERLDRVTNVHAFGPFLRGITRNVVREHFRQQANEVQRYLQLVEDQIEARSEELNPDWLSDPELVKTLRACLQGLPQRSQRMIAMRYTEELSSELIGEEVGINAAAVRSALRRAREALLQCIRANYELALEM